MPDTHQKARVKCAEIYCILELGIIEYECTGCQKIFGSHNICMQHFKGCRVLGAATNEIETNTTKDALADCAENPVPDDTSFSISEEKINIPEPVAPSPIDDTHFGSLSHLDIELLSVPESTEVSNDSQSQTTTYPPFKRSPLEDITEEAYHFSQTLIERLAEHGQLNFLVCDICNHHTDNRLKLLAHMYHSHINNYLRKRTKPLTKHAKESLQNTKNPTQPVKKTRRVDKQIHCDQCERVFKGMAQLNQHKHFLHSDGTRFPCRTCRKSFDTMEERKAHMFSDHLKRIFTCEICGVFSTRFGANFDSHMRTHTGERPFVCNEANCAKACASKSELNKHKKHVHSDARPYICLVCLSAFKTQGSLTGHIRVRHTRNFSILCSVCNKGFHSKAALQTHSYSHTGERPFACSMCEKRFADVTAMKHHENRHTNTLPYKCRTAGCELMFPSTSGRYFHEKSVHSIARELNNK